MNIARWLLARAQLGPDAPALLDGTRVDADYRTFAHRAGAIARALRDHHGIAPGDRVGVFMTNRTRYLECLYGIWWAGAVAVPVNAKLHGREAAWIFADAEATLAFVADHTLEALHAVADSEALPPLVDVDGPGFTRLYDSPPDPEPLARESDDLAWLFYTSGTTGRPKGVMLSHGNLTAMSLSYLADVDEAHAEDAIVYAAPMSHGAGMYNFIHVRVGARHVVPASGGFDADEVLDLGHALGNLTFFAAPTIVRRLTDAARRRGENGAGIKTIIYGGAPMYLADLEDAIAVMGQRFVEIYGQGESPMAITALARTFHAETASERGRARLASVGVAQSVVEVRVADQDGRTLPPGETGEIVVKGPTVMRGYWRNPKATADAIRDGWLFTGDLGRMDDDGFLTLTDRSKDVIISGGTNIYPREVEEALLTHPAVREVCVVGEPDPEWGENVVAYVVTAPDMDVTDAALDAHCLSSIARFKRPKRYERRDELPKSNYGKILKTVLRAEITARHHPVEG
ncbi:class I adenylate-forming enzyme family protein [Xanthobacter agilis]|uniref:class I adenylate-forming enzyme family protein n=1 Tax=Xanthobacter agilis TaxID=47492 RepID=UPI00372A9DCE